MLIWFKENFYILFDIQLLSLFDRLLFSAGELFLFLVVVNDKF